MKNIGKKQKKYSLEKNFSDEFNDLYVKMVAFKPKDRLKTIKEILNHEWFKEINNDTYKTILNETIKEEFGRIYDQMGKETTKQI